MGRIKNHNHTKDKMNKIIALAALAFIGAQAADDTIAQKLNGGEREDDGGRRLAVDSADIQVINRIGMSKAFVNEVIDHIDWMHQIHIPSNDELISHLNDNYYGMIDCIGNTNGGQFVLGLHPGDKAV